MTRLAILADIHGNLPALEAVLDDLTHFDVDYIVVAGDVISWGPFSPQVMERLSGVGVALLRGNAELYLLDYRTPRAPAAWSEYTLLPSLSRQLRGRWQNVIAAWPDGLSLRFPDAPTVRVAHGSPRSPWEPIYPGSDEEVVMGMLESVEETTVIVGHTHLPMDRAVGKWRVLNPGSVGVPLDGQMSASYMLLDGSGTGWLPTFRRLPFDYAPLWEEFERQEFVNIGGVTAHLVVQEFKTARLQVHPFLRWRHANYPRAPLTMDLLEKFREINIWDYTPIAYHVHVES